MKNESQNILIDVIILTTNHPLWQHFLISITMPKRQKKILLIDLWEFQ